MLKLFTFAQSFVVEALYKKEEGQTMAEYGVVLAVITVLIIGVLMALSESIQAKLQSVVDVLA